jgi:hypothetical protein
VEERRRVTQTQSRKEMHRAVVSWPLRPSAYATEAAVAVSISEKYSIHAEKRAYTVFYVEVIWSLPLTGDLYAPPG